MERPPTSASSARPRGSPPTKKSRPLIVRILRDAGFVLLLILTAYFAKRVSAGLGIMTLIGSIGLFLGGNVGGGLVVLLLGVGIGALYNWRELREMWVEHQF